MPTVQLDLTKIWSVQNKDLFKEYLAKKQAIREKSFCGLQSTDVLKKYGEIKTKLIDDTTNEYYMWCYAPNADKIVNHGKALEIIVDPSS